MTPKRLSRKIAESKASKLNKTETKTPMDWQAFVDSFNHPIIVIDSDCKITYANQSAIDFRVPPPEGVIGSYYPTLLYGMSDAIMECPVKKTMSSNERAYTELYLREKDIWVGIDSLPLNPTVKEPKQILCIVDDITARKKIEAEKESIENTSRMVFEAVNDVIVVADTAGNVLDISPSVEEVLGYKPEEIIGANYQDFAFFNTETKLKADDDMGRGLKGERTRLTEYQAVSRNGEVKIFEVNEAPVVQNNKVVSIIAVIRDITRRKRVEEALIESEENYKALAENPLTGIFIIQNGNTVFYNKRFADMHGYNSTELLNTSTLSLVHPDYQEWSHLRVNEVTAGVRPPEIGEQLRLKKNGESFWAESIITPIIYKGEKALAGIVLDISDRKKAQEEMKIAHDELAKAIDKLEKRNSANSIMSEMRDLIQLASSMSEIPPIIQNAMKKLFPGAGGALFILSDSRSDLEATSRWGEFPDDVDENVFAPDACWALRRGHAHIIEDMQVGPVCPHLKHLPSMSYACIPMIAKGEVIGLLHLRNGESMSEAENQLLITSLHDIAVSISEYLSLSIANLKLRETLKYQSIKDPLTGLFNRRFMTESFNREISRASRNKTKIGIIMLDIDHFKKFNDTWGHAAGDELLIQLGKFFRERTRESDIACRYGGEEFAILMPESGVDDTYKRAEKLREDVKSMRASIGGQLLPPINLSMGIAEYPTHGKTVDDLLHVADAALYRAKQEGRDRVVVA